MKKQRKIATVILRTIFLAASVRADIQFSSFGMLGADPV